MPIQLAPLVGAGIGALQQSKIDKALAGEKTYTKPKTIFGKLIGSVSGRSAASEVSQQSTQSQKMIGLSEIQKSQERTSTPITGGFSFGGEATKRTYLPFYLGAVVLGIFFFMRRKGGRRRR